MRRLILLIGVLAVLCLALPTIAFADDGYTFDADTETLTVTTNEGFNNAYNEIGNSNAVNLVIARGVTDISNANLFKRLYSVKIPDSVTSIPDGVFAGCTGLKVEMANSVTSIGNNAFENCIALRINLSDNVTSIGNSAFAGCRGMVCMDIPGSVTSIGDFAFADCSSLIYLVFRPEVAPTMGNGVFNGCNHFELLVPDEPDTKGYKGDALSNGWENYQSIISDDGYTFDADTNTLTFTANYGFMNALYKLGSTDQDNLVIAPGVTDMSNIKSYSYASTVTLQDGITSIPEGTFKMFMRLYSVKIPNSVVSIGDDAFNGCMNLRSVVIPDSVTSIGKGAFASCYELESVVIPPAVTSIGASAFASCGLTTLDVPPSVTSVGDGAFNCVKLETVTFRSEVAPTIGKDVFGEGCRLILPKDPETKGYIGSELSAGWDNYQGMFGRDGYTFDEDTKTLTITSDEGITKLPSARYHNCTKAITIQDGVTKIGDNTFVMFPGIKSVAIPSSVTSIGEGAFSECDKLETVSFASKVAPTIGSDCFGYTRIVVPVGQGVTGYEGEELSAGWEEYQKWIAGHEIDDYTFKDGLLTIGSREAEYGWRMSIKPEDVLSAVVDGDVQILDYDMFKGCKNLVSVKLQNGIGAISAAFGGCSSLQKISIPESVEWISDEVFKDCSSLESVTFEPKKAPGIGVDVFVGCSPDLKLYVYRGDDVSGYTGDNLVFDWEDYQQYIELIDRPEAISYTISSVSKTYGDGKFTNPATGSGTITYTSSNPAVAGVDEATGEVTIVGAGAVTITAKAADGSSASYTLTVSKAPLEMRAEDRSMTKGSTLPTLTYKVIGLVNGDKITGPPSITVSTDGKTVGTFDILISGGSVYNVNNYDISYSKGTLTVSDPAPSPGGGGGGSSAPDNNTGEVDKNTVTIEGKGEEDSITVNLPKLVQDKVIQDKIKNTRLLVDKYKVSVNLDIDAVKAINKQANADVQISAVKVDPKELSVGGRPAYNMSATYDNGSKHIKEFGSGKVTVTIPYKLQSNENPEGIGVVYIDDNGNVTNIPNAYYDSKNSVVVFTTNHFSMYMVSYKPTFNDIANHWAKSDIEAIASEGIMVGTTPETFSPNEPMTRGMFIATIGRMESAPTDNHNTKFVDVSPTSYYCPYIAWATSRGVVSGTSETTFSPDSPITREQMATIMFKTFGTKLTKEQKPTTFKDSDAISSWAKEAVSVLQQAGVLSGRSDGTFDPKATATRAEVASILNRLRK